jgi:hypothetical protein
VNLTNEASWPISTVALLLVACATPTLAQDCELYTSLGQLPSGFEMIAGGDLGKAELFVLSDGVCTCMNQPAVDRELGKSLVSGANWSCRPATPDEHRSE